MLPVVELEEFVVVVDDELPDGDVLLFTLDLWDFVEEFLVPPVEFVLEEVFLLE